MGRLFAIRVATTSPAGFRLSSRSISPGILAGIILTLFKPMRNPVVLPVDDQIELESSKGAKIVGVGVVIATIALYAVFW
jgi:hypothetical protein